MEVDEQWLQAARRYGLLVDTNLLVLLIVGSVNISRVGVFKRTASYTAQDYRLLLELMELAGRICSVAHVFSEVSNLTDLKGIERQLALRELKRLINRVHEPAIASELASDHSMYERLGLTDAAILTAAVEHKYAVLTADLDLQLALISQRVPTLNFTNLRNLEL